jgi:hypothetical protein
MCLSKNNGKSIAGMRDGALREGKGFGSALWVRGKGSQDQGLREIDRFVDAEMLDFALGDFVEEIEAQGILVRFDFAKTCGLLQREQWPKTSLSKMAVTA